MAVAAAEWVGSGQALGSPVGILWSVVALLGVVGMLLGAGLELRRRRQVAAQQAAAPQAAPAPGPAAARPGPPPGRSQVPELPTGTVTFLFTDIEGSTRLLQELGGRYPAVRDEHAAILRQAIRDREGVEVSTEGDSFFAAFASPVATVGAAVAAQRGLAAHPWPEGFPVRPSFELTEENAQAVAGICARLDGLPLAIELAATRTKVLSPEQILPRLRRSLTLLTGGARTLPDRQRTLRGAIAWSYDLLGAAEQRLFARLSVFSGGWTLASAEAVGDPEGLGLDPLEATTSLVDQSLATTTTTGAAAGGPRFSMLETIREFGRERLAASGEPDEVARRHASWFLDLAVAAEPHLGGADQGEWLDRCDLEHANLRAALRWAVEALQPVVRGRRRGRLRRRLRVARGEPGAGPAGRGRAGATRAEWMLVIRELAAGDWDRTLPVAERAVATWRRLGDRLQMADGLVWLGVCYIRAGRPADARSAIREALGLFRDIDSPMGIVSVILGLSYLARWEGRYQDAVRLAGAAESLREQVGGRPPQAAWEEGRRLGVEEALEG